MEESRRAEDALMALAASEEGDDANEVSTSPSEAPNVEDGGGEFRIPSSAKPSKVAEGLEEGTCCLLLYAISETNSTNHQGFRINELSYSWVVARVEEEESDCD